MFKKFLQIGNWLVSGVLFAGALSLLFVTVPQLGNRTLIVRSGSMEPAIGVGDLVVVRSSDGPFKIGDVIAYRNPGKRSMVVTHRVVEVLQGEKSREYITKGDANDVADNYVVPEEFVLGRQWLVVPMVGRIFAFARTKLGFLSLIVIPSAIVVISESAVITRELLKKRRVPVLKRGGKILDRKQAITFSNLVPALSFIGASPPPVRLYVDGLSRRLVLFIVAAAVLLPTTDALYVDSEITEDNSFVAAEDFGVDPGAVVINEVMWMGSAGDANGEWIELRNMTGGEISLEDWQIDAAASGSNAVTLNGTIAANGFWLLSRQATASSAITDSITADQVASSIRLNNSGEQLKLRDDTSAIIDQTPLPPGWPAGVSTGGDRKSMERNGTPGDGTVGINWHTCTDAGCNDGTYWDTPDGNNYGTPQAENL